ncbi:hypothetical protein AFLA_002370 [Aspergillus flavus NRRL3357]|nr:hypothetical protein AFLA_002370 [Aspergillus flavus NRRL3357]
MISSQPPQPQGMWILSWHPPGIPENVIWKESAKRKVFGVRRQQAHHGEFSTTPFAPVGLVIAHWRIKPSTNLSSPITAHLALEKAPWLVRLRMYNAAIMRHCYGGFILGG